MSQTTSCCDRCRRTASPRGTCLHASTVPLDANAPDFSRCFRVRQSLCPAYSIGEITREHEAICMSVCAHSSTTAVREWHTYRNSDFKRLDRMNLCTACTILVTFDPETSEFTLLTIAPVVAIRQKLAYHAKYIRMS